MAGKTISTYLNEFRTDNHLKPLQLPDTTAIVRFNRYYHDLENDVANFVQDNFFTETIEMDIVAGQKKYALPSGNSISDTNPPIKQFKKLLQISLKYDSNQDYYTMAKPRGISDLDRGLDRYETNQSSEIPFFIFNNDDIEIYPTPTEGVLSGILLRYARTDVDLEVTDDEEDISLPWQYIKTILIGMQIPLYKARGDQNMMNNSMQEYEVAKRDSMKKITDRYAQPAEGGLLPSNLNTIMYY